MSEQYKPKPRIKKVINITKVFDDESKGKSVAVVDQDGEKYSFFRTEYNKDTPSEAYGYMCEHKLKEGDTVGIQFYMKGEYQNVDKFFNPQAEDLTDTNVPPFKSAGEVSLNKAEKDLQIARSVVAKIMGDRGLTYEQSAGEREQWTNWIVNGEPTIDPNVVDEKTIDLTDM